MCDILTTFAYDTQSVGCDEYGYYHYDDMGYDINEAAQRQFDAEVERALNYENEPLHEYDPLEEAEARWELENDR